MVKTIVGKRSTKNVSVEEYWDTKHKTRNRKTEQEIQNKKNVHIDISRRHRFTSDHHKKKQLDVNIAHKIQQVQVLPHSHEEDDIGSFWYDELEYTRNITRYAEFVEFYEDIQPYSQSLSIILHNLSIIVDKLLHHLKKCRREVKIIILQIVPSLIRDTQQYLYKEFCDKILVQLVEMIVITDMELLEKVYNVLAFALKYLFDQIVENPEQFYTVYFSKLFSHSNKHIRHFSSESFSYILKKVKSQERKALINLIIKSMVQPENYFQIQQQQENNVEIQQEKLQLAISSLGELVFTSLRGIGYFLNQKSIEIFKSFVQQTLQAQQKSQEIQQIEDLQIQQQSIENIAGVLEFCMYNLSKKIASRELEDKLVFNFNDIFTTFTSIFKNFHQKQSSKDNKHDHILYNSLAKILIQIIECENGLKLDEVCASNIIQLINILIEFSQQNPSQYTQNLQINLAELIGVFLRGLYNKDFYKKQNYDQEKINLTSILNFILDTNNTNFSLNLEQSFHFIYRLVKAHNRSDIEKDLIVKNEQYYKDCYNLPQELLNYLFIVVINQMDKIQDQQNLQIYNLIYQLNVAVNYSDKNSQKFSLKKNVDLVESVFTEKFPKIIQQFIENKQFVLFMQSLSLLKFYKNLQLSEKTQTDFSKSLTKLRDQLNEKLQQHQQYQIDEKIKQNYMDLQNESSFYTIPIEIQKQYLQQPISSLLDLNYEDFLIILKGEIMQIIGSETKNFLNILEKELDMLPKIKAYSNPVYLKSLYIFLKNNLKQNQLLNIQKYNNAFQCLLNNLHNKFHEIRLYSLEILRFFDFTIENQEVVQDLEKDENSTIVQLDQKELMRQILLNLLEIENHTASLQFERAIKLAIERNRQLLIKQKIENIPVLVLQILINYFCGYAFVRFQLLWDPIKEFLSYLISLSTEKTNKKQDQENFLYKQFLTHLKFYNWLALQDKPSLKQNLFQNERESVILNQESLKNSENYKYCLNFSEIFEDDHFLEMDSLDELIVLDTLFNALIQSKQTVSKERLSIQMFFKQFIENEHKKSLQVKIDQDQENKSLIKTLTDINCEKSDIFIKQQKKSYYKKLELFLKLYYNIQGQKQLDKEYFFSYFNEFLRKDNEKVQQLALENLTKYSIDGINIHKDSIQRLIKKDTFRSEITTFNSENHKIPEIHRPHLIPVMISVLYPKLFSKRGIKHKAEVEVKKNIIFAMFSGFQEQELQFFIDLLLEDFGIPKKLVDFELKNDQKQFSQELIQLTAQVPLQRLQGYLINLKNIFDKVGILLKPFLSQIFNTVLGILQLCQTAKQNLKDLSKEETQEKNTNNTSKVSIVHKLIKETNKVGFQRISELFKKFDDYTNIQNCVYSFLSIFEQKILNIQSECVKSPSGVFKVLCTFAEVDNYQKYLIQTQEHQDLFQSPQLKNNILLSQIISIYNNQNLAPELAQLLNKLLADLMFFNEQKAQSLELEKNDLDLYLIHQQQITQQREQKQEQCKQIVQNLGISLLQNLVQYLKNTFQGDAKHGKTISNCLQLVYQVIETYIPQLQQQDIQSDEDIKILNDSLEYFIKLFDNLRSKKLYVSLQQSTDYSHQNIKDQDQKQSMLDKIKKDKDLFFIILQIIESIIRVSTNAELFYEFIVQQLPYLTDIKFRSKIVNIIAKLNVNFISQDTIQMLLDMNAEDMGVEKTLDFEKVIPCYYKFNSEIIQQSQNYKEMELILLNYLSHIQEDELSIKIAIESGFKSFFSKILEDYSNIVNSEENLKILRQFLFSRFLPFVQDGFKKSVNKEPTMKVYVKLLDHYVHIFSQIYQLDQNSELQFFTEKSKHESAVAFLSLKVVQNKTDLNQDFFENIFDIQLPKRIKSLLILQKNYTEIQKHQDNLVKFLIPLFDFVIFTKCQEISKGNKLSFTETARSHFKSLLQVSIELYSVSLPSISWNNQKIVLKKLMVYLNKKDDKTVVKLMGEIIKKLDLGELQQDIIEKVNKEMNANKNKILEKGLMRKFIKQSQKKQGLKYDEKQDEVVKDKGIQDLGDHIDEYKATDVMQEENMEMVEQKMFKQLEKNEVLLQKQLQVKQDYLKSQGKDQDQKETTIQDQKDMENEDDEKNRQEQIKSLRSRQNFLKVTLFIPLKSLLFAKYSTFKLEKKNEKVQNHIATALTNLCSKFSEEDFRLEFPKIVGKLCKTMKDKRVEVRDQTRKVLCEIIRITGPYFLHFVIRELTFYLNQGWEGHILNFTIYQLISHLDQSNNCENGQIDYCMGDILEAMIPEIFGRLEEEKNSEIGKRIPELKKNKAFECVHMVAKMINFQDSILSFLGFIKKELQEHLHNAKYIHKFEELFRNSQQGFEKNPTVSLESLLLVSISLIKDSVELIEHSRKKEHLLDTTQKLGSETLKKSDVVKHNKEKTYSILDVTAQNKSIFTEMTKMKRQSMMKVGAHLSNFGLKLVLLGIKKQIFTQQLMKENEEICLQFEQLLKLIIQCLDTSDNTMLQNALKVLKEVLIWPLRFIKRHKKSIINASIEVIQKLTVTDQDLIQDTFKMVQIVINHFSVDQFKPTQIQGLLEFIKQFSEQSDFLTEPLNTLKLLIEKKFIHLEVYNLLDLVKVKMIQCYNRAIQSICKNIFLSFLLNYPLSDKLLQNYINFLIKNTEYTDPNGRSLVYEVLKTFLEKFPEQVTRHFGEILFIALLVNKSKETVPNIQIQIQDMLKITLQQLNKQKQLVLLNNCFTWLDVQNGSKLGIISAAFQGMNLFIEIGEIYQHKKFTQGFQNIVSPRITSLFTLIENSLQAYKREMKLVKLARSKISQEQKEHKDKLQEITQQADKTLENLNPVFISGLQFIQSLLQKNRNMVKDLIFSEVQNDVDQNSYDQSDEEEEENDQQIYDKDHKKTLLCQLLSFTSHPSQEIQNEVVKLINIVFDLLQENVQELFQTNKLKAQKRLIPQILKSLYIYKIKNNTVIEGIQDQHQLVFNSVEMFRNLEQDDLVEQLLFNIKKFTQKALSKTDQNIKILENIIDLYKKLVVEGDQDEEIRGLTQYITKEVYLEHILVPVIKLKNQEEQLQKIKNCQILEKCESLIDQIKKQCDLNYFFSVYSNVKVKMQNVANEKKIEKKQMAVLDPEKAAQQRKIKNQQRYKSKKNVYKNKIKGSVPSKILKTE